MGKIASSCQQSVSDFDDESMIDFTLKTNMLRLKDQVDRDDVAPQHVKQRTDRWFELRKSAKVTGSTIHSAIGLRGLKQQKIHFQEFICGEKQMISESIQEKMNYGTENEQHALATLVGTILPIYFPKASYVEEGCYIQNGKSTDALMEVSPDGSIREVKYNSDGKPYEVGECLAAVEIKCPFPTENHAGVHYTLPTYYVAQCLAEMFVLETDHLVYMSYGKQSSTVFLLQFDAELWRIIWEEICFIYDRDDVKRPTRSRENVKHVRDRIRSYANSNVTFLGEFRSQQMTASDVEEECEWYPYLYAKSKVPLKTYTTVLSSENIQHSMRKCLLLLDEGYNLQRRKATEIMVWVLTTKHRNSKSELPCSVPIAFGLKDYRLTSAAMRKATEHVIDQCQKRNIRIDSLSTDGQWIQLMHRDSEGNPLTVYQLQKDVWKAVKSMAKANLVKQISQYNVINVEKLSENLKIEKYTYTKTTNGINYTYHGLMVESKTNAFQTIVTNLDKGLWQGKTKDRDDNEEVTDEKEFNFDTALMKAKEADWLPVELIKEIEEERNVILMKAISLVEDARSNHEHVQQAEIDSSVSKSGTPHTEEELSCKSDTLNEDIITTDVGIQNIPTTGQNTDNLPIVSFYDMLAILKASDQHRKRWDHFNEESLKLHLSCEENVLLLTHAEMNSIYQVIEGNKLNKTSMPMRKSWTKSEKAALLNYLLGNTSNHLSQRQLKPSTKKSASCLKSLTLNVLKSRKIPKDILCTAYAQAVFPEKLRYWQTLHSVPEMVQIGDYDDENIQWFSVPESSKQSKSLLAKSVDCSHNFTHLRVRTSTTGILGVPADAWKACARSNETQLKISMVEDLLDKQSVPNARTHFSSSVEQWMMSHNYMEAAKLVQLIRNWYEASDSPEMPAVDRIRHLLAFRRRLLDQVNFGQFPPLTRYIKGIPVVTYEGILLDIDTKIQLHGICGPYNIRSVGSLAAETAVGLLQTLNQSSQVSIKAVDVPNMMSSAVQLMTCKLNPER
jgi:hypothetical protein